MIKLKNDIRSEQNNIYLHFYTFVKMNFSLKFHKFMYDKMDIISSQYKYTVTFSKL